MRNPGSDAGVFVWNNDVNTCHNAANADASLATLH
jgi:hypothetical protein